MLSEYRPSSGREFWSEHWGQHPVEELLEIARRSPLTNLITQALPTAGAILEAGCGPGSTSCSCVSWAGASPAPTGVIDPLVACRRVAPAPLAAMKLEELAVRDGALAAYISLGAVEHDKSGPDAILAEARRALAPGGTLVLSVPYVNGVRRLASPWLRRQSRAVKRPRRNVLSVRVHAARALGGPGPPRLPSTRRRRPTIRPRLLRKALPGGIARRLTSMPAGSVVATGGERRGHARSPGSGPTARAMSLARHLLYTAPALRLLGHMLLVVARKT